jgi:transposase
MPIIRSNAIRIKRFRELKQDLRTKRDRLLLGIDIAKAEDVAQVRHAHTRILDRSLRIPNTPAGFARFWAHLGRRRAETGVSEIICAVEPTGTYHDALARFLESRGVDVLLVSNTVAHHNRRTLDGTWGKSDPKDAHNLCDLLERGHVLFYSLPDEPTAALRRLVRLLRQARVERGACQARFRTTLLPLLGPAGAPLPLGLVASLPAPLRRLCPAAEVDPRRRGQARREPAGWAERAPGPALPPGLSAELTDLVARLTAVQGRIATIEAALVQVAEPLPASALLRTIPGVGPTVAAILLAEIGDIGWYTKFSQLRKLAGLDIIGVATGNWTGATRISKGGRPLLRWALYQAAMGACRNGGWRARREGLIAKRQGDRFAFLKANVELAAKLLRLVWGVWRSGRRYDPSYRSDGPAAGPAIAPGRARAGRRGAPPSGPGRAAIVKPRGRQAGRVSGRRAGDPKNAPSRRSR